ncbi:hypothetical protein DS838_003858 [Geotrichum bryndzae]|nr:hypothetical protein DS838_003858 [Geotrichum bryndzae]
MSDLYGDDLDDGLVYDVDDNVISDTEDYGDIEAPPTPKKEEPTQEKKQQQPKKRKAEEDKEASSNKKKKFSEKLNDILLSESSFKDTSDFVPERNDENLGHFVSFFLKDHLTKKDQAKKKKNTNKNKKFVLILAQSAIRVCDVTRLFKGHEQTIPFGAIKLIKKNKLSYDEKALNSSPSNLLVGTVGRVAKLIENKMLDPKTISAIIVESTFLDDKLQNVWDSKDTVPFLKSILTSFEDDDKRRPLIYLY